MKQAWAVAVVALLVAAGVPQLSAFFEGQDGSSAEVSTSAVDGFAFEDPTELPPCDLSGDLRSCTLAKEPTFDVGPDDGIWMTGAGAVGFTSQVWYSPDLGDTWEHVGFQATDAGRHTAGAEGDVAVDPRGTAYVFDTNLWEGWWSIFEDPLLPPTSIPVTRPVGPEGPYLLPGSPADTFDRPWLIALGPGEVFFTYNNGGITYRITRDGGLTWSAPVTVTGGCNLGRPLHLGGERFAFASACLSGRIDGSSTTWFSAPHLFLPDGPVQPDPFGGEDEHWSREPVVTPVHDGSGDPIPRDALPIMDLARANGTWFVAGADEPETRAYLSWGSPEEGWSTEWLGPSDASWFPAVAARDDGRVAVAYVSREAGTWTIRAELRAPDGTVLNTTLVEDRPVAPAWSNPPSRGAMGDFIDLGWLPDGRLLVAWGAAPSGDGIPEDRSRIWFARSGPVAAP